MQSGVKLSPLFPSQEDLNLVCYLNDNQQTDVW